MVRMRGGIKWGINVVVTRTFRGNRQVKICFDVIPKLLKLVSNPPNNYKEDQFVNQAVP